MNNDDTLRINLLANSCLRGKGFVHLTQVVAWDTEIPGVRLSDLFPVVYPFEWSNIFTFENCRKSCKLYEVTLNFCI